MENKSTNILEGVYRRYGIHELFYHLMEMYHISFFNLNIKNTMVSFDDNDIIINEGKRRFIVHHEEEYTVLSKEYDDYEEVLYIDTEGGVFRQTALFRIGNGKVLAVDGFNDESLQSRRIVRTIESDKLLEGGDFERDFTAVSSGLVKEDYCFVKISEDKEESVKKIILPNDGFYYRAEKTEKKAYLVSPVTSRLEISASRNIPSFKFYGRVRGKRELICDSLKCKYPNIIMEVRENDGKSSSIMRIAVMKFGGRLVLKLLTANGEKEIALKGMDDDLLTAKDVDVLIDFISSEGKIDNINLIIAELMKLKDALLLIEKKSNKVVDFLDMKIQHFESFEEFVFDVRNNKEQYEQMIDGQIRNMSAEKGYEKKFLKS